MKLNIERYSLQIIPETPVDEAWLEEVLGLMKEGDSVPLVRVHPMDLSCWAYVEAKAKVKP